MISSPQVRVAMIELEELDVFDVVTRICSVKLKQY
jgi:hypothetical protein